MWGEVFEMWWGSQNIGGDIENVERISEHGESISQHVGKVIEVVERFLGHAERSIRNVVEVAGHRGRYREC